MKMMQSRKCTWVQFVCRFHSGSSLKKEENAAAANEWSEQKFMLSMAASHEQRWFKMKEERNGYLDNIDAGTERSTTSNADADQIALIFRDRYAPGCYPHAPVFMCSLCQGRMIISHLWGTNLLRKPSFSVSGPTASTTCSCSHFIPLPLLPISTRPSSWVSETSHNHEQQQEQRYKI